jgi:hypothetical protein
VIDLQYYADMMRAAVELKVVYITMKQKPLKCGTGGLKMADFIKELRMEKDDIAYGITVDIPILAE